MTETQTPPVETFEYKAEMKQLLHLIVHSLYTHEDVFLRELISNAADALNKVHFRLLTDRDVVSAKAPLKITIQPNPEKRTLTIEDTGIGMTHEDLVDRIGTVASSGTLSFLEEMKKADQPLDAQLIGQFGVGFYSVFMVAEEVIIETRHADPDSKGYRWRSTGAGTYSIEEIERTERGTKLIVKLKESADQFGQESWVKEIIKRYSNFVDFPIYVGDTQVNTVKALWHKGKNEITEEELTAFYTFITADVNPPLGYNHLQIEGTVNFRALLFVPSVAPASLFQDVNQKGLHLYSNKVFIQEDNTGLLPDYLKFIRGVVDTEDLPLNVSREVTQASPVMAKIRSILTGKILGMLEELGAEEPDKYDTFFKQFGELFKTGVGADFANRERLMNLLRFESTKTEQGAYTSFKDYVGRMQEGQTAIYYVLGEHRDVVERNPSLEYFKRKDLEVLLLLDPIDVLIMPAVGMYEDKMVQSIEMADLELEEDEALQQDALPTDQSDRVIALFGLTLGDKVKEVRPSKRLVDSAVTLVVGGHGMGKQMERLMKMMNQEFTADSKILEINMAHPLIKNMARLIKEGGQATLLESLVLQLYEGALLLEGSLDQKSTFVDRMTDLMVRASQ